MLPPDLRSELRWLASGFLLTLSSGPGQTFYIALFAGHLKNELAISDGQFGTLYTVATLASAAALTWAGKLADRFSVRALGVAVLGGFALAALGMAAIASVWMLGAALFGLRFFGQGMAMHVAMTAMGRWFNRKRGRAVAIAALGLPAAEAVLPPLAVAGVALIGWRGTWAAAAAALALIAAPVLIALLRRERRPSSPEDGERASGPVQPEWTRREVLHSPLFYALLPGVLAQPLIVTGIFFNQVTIVETKAWQMTWLAASYPVLAAMHVVSALGAGWMVDRFGARRLLPALLLPLGAAALLLGFAASPYVLPVFMALAGLTQGLSSTVQGALWPELYGLAHLGAIRGVVMAGVVFASALAPGVIGVLLDAGIAFDAQLMVMAGYCFLVAAWMATLMPRLNRLAGAHP